MYSKLKKDLRLRNNLKRNINNKWIYSFITKNENKLNSIKYKQSFLLDNFLSSKICYKNRCILTNKGRGIHRITQLSSASFKEIFREQQVNGFKKGSW